MPKTKLKRGIFGYGVKFKPRCCIYALTCPLTGEIRYVGQTRHLQKRYLQHLANSYRNGMYARHGNHIADDYLKSPFMAGKDKWVANLLRRGLIPGLLILEFCKERQLTNREQYWADFHLCRGARLTNWQLVSKKRLPHDYQI